MRLLLDLELFFSGAISLAFGFFFRELGPFLFWFRGGLYALCLLLGYDRFFYPLLLFVVRCMWVLVIYVFLFPIGSMPTRGGDGVVFLYLHPLLPFDIPFSFACGSSNDGYHLGAYLYLRSSLTAKCPESGVGVRV